MLAIEQRPDLDEARSVKEGRQFYIDRVYLTWLKIGASSPTGGEYEVFPRNRCKIEAPEIWNDATPVTGEEMFRRWQSNNDLERIEGTPLKLWPPITPGQVKMLENVNVLSVESLAQLPDSSIERLFPGIRRLRTQAIAYIKAAEDTGKIALANAALQDQIEAMGATMRQMQAELMDQRANRPRGRPRNSRRHPESDDTDETEAVGEDDEPADGS
jgi:uncharacterized protein with von Willebrand factor type A (vWA) domain